MISWKTSSGRDSRDRERQHRGKAPASLRAVGLAHGAGAQLLLDRVTLSLSPGSLVAVLGASGAGKSVLLSLLSGRCRPDQGSVRLGAEELETSPSASERIGFVPQRDVVFENLTALENLSYAATLRPGVAPGAVARAVKLLGLRGKEHVLVRRLSGGERKRVNVGVELLHDPPVLVLDEPTAGLDPATERWIMQFFRSAADEGRLVVLSTHTPRSLALCDQVLVLHGGRMIFQGSPGELEHFFGVGGVEELYDALRRQTAAEWEREFRQSLLGDGARSGTTTSPERAARARAREPEAGAQKAGRPARPRSSWLRQARDFGTLTSRYFLCLLRDRWLSAILLGQAPLIGLFILVAYRSETAINDTQLLFKFALSAIWFGCITACRELVKERRSYLRERFAGLGLVPYVASKVAVLLAVTGLQVLLLVVTVRVFRRLPVEFLPLAGALWVTAGVSLLMGLALSAWVRNSDQALSVVPLVLIPQAILVSVVFPLEGLGNVFENAMISTWSFRWLGELAKQEASWGGEAAPLAIIAAALLAAVLAGVKRLDSRRELRDL